MAVIIGQTGSVVFANGYVVNAKAFTLNITADEHDITDFESTAAWAEYMHGIKRWSGSFECFADDTTAIDTAGEWDVSEGTATFTASTGRTYAGSIIALTNDVTVNPADPNKVTVSFRGTGALTVG